MDASGLVTRLHSFNGADGETPHAELLEGSDGHFYGTTYAGGANELGTVFRVESNGVFTSLHAFAGSDGSNPDALIEFEGDFLGTTFGGGETIRARSSAWIRRGTSPPFIVRRSDGSRPSAALLLASDGNFYGTTTGGGQGYGTVFRMDQAERSPPITRLRTSVGDAAFGAHRGRGREPLQHHRKERPRPGNGLPRRARRSYAMLHVFSGNLIFAAVTETEDGDFFVTTPGSDLGGPGTVERMTPLGEVTTIHRFPGREGAGPWTSLLRAADGALYGTTPFGGVHDGGTAFRLNADGASRRSTTSDPNLATGYIPSPASSRRRTGFSFGSQTMAAPAFGHDLSDGRLGKSDDAP